MLILTLFYATDVLFLHFNIKQCSLQMIIKDTYLLFVKEIKKRILILEDQKCVPHLSDSDTKRLQPDHRDSKGCHMISARMSAKQLYFPRISRAQRRPFFDRNPLFLEGVYFQAVETIGPIRLSRKRSIRAIKGVASRDGSSTAWKLI